jgi:hypothetical protein
VRSAWAEDDPSISAVSQPRVASGSRRALLFAIVLRAGREFLQSRPRPSRSGAPPREEETKQRLMKPIFDFLRSRDARMACPFCGHGDWRGWDERIALEHVVSSATVDRGTEAFPLTCTHCGFIRLQSADVLDDPRSPTRQPRA